MKERIVKFEEQGQDQFNAYARVTLTGTAAPTETDVSNYAWEIKYYGGRIVNGGAEGENYVVTVALYKD